MKKEFAFLMMAAMLAACAQEERPEVIDQPEVPTTYTMIVQATKDSEGYSPQSP